MKKILFTILSSVLALSAYSFDISFPTNVNLCKGQSVTFAVAVTDNTAGFENFNGQITLPTGVSITACSKGDIAVDQTPSFNLYDASTNLYRIAATSGTDSKITGDGTFLYVTIKSDGSHTVGNVLTASYDGWKLGTTALSTTGNFNITITDAIIVDENATFVPFSATGQKAQLIRSFESGKFYTVCLPFTVAPTGPNTTALGGTFPTLYKYTGVTSEMNDSWDGTKSITINFSTATGAIAANTPFLVKFNAACTNPTFTGCAFNTNSPVTSFSEPNMGALVDFVGTYAASKTLAAGDLYLKGGKLYSVPTTGTVAMKGTRAYFDLSGLAAAGVPLEVKMCVDGEETSIDAIDSDLKAEGWFDLNGRKLAQKPATKGVYINNGKKVVVK